MFMTILLLIEDSIKAITTGIYVQDERFVVISIYKQWWWYKPLYKFLKSKLVSGPQTRGIGLFLLHTFLFVECPTRSEFNGFAMVA